MELHDVTGLDDRLELAGICLGLVGEEAAVLDQLKASAPAVLALGVAPEMVEELAGLEPEEHLGSEDHAYVVGLSRWGDVALPGPEFAAAAEAAGELGIKVVGVDLDEITFLDLYSETISYPRMLRRSFKVRRLARRPPKADDPHAFCRAFDVALNKGPFLELERERERAMAERCRELVADGSVLAIVEVQRLDGITRALRQASVAAADH